VQINTSLLLVSLGSPSWWDYSWPRCAGEGQPFELLQEGMWRKRCHNYLRNTYFWWSWELANAYCKYCSYAWFFYEVHI